MSVALRDRDSRVKRLHAKCSDAEILCHRITLVQCQRIVSSIELREDLCFRGDKIQIRAVCFQAPSAVIELDQAQRDLSEITEFHPVTQKHGALICAVKGRII